jgi:hypothetical protein
MFVIIIGIDILSNVRRQMSNVRGQTSEEITLTRFMQSLNFATVCTLCSLFCHCLLLLFSQSLSLLVTLRLIPPPFTGHMGLVQTHS